jgi:hypothetical protein
MAKAPVSKTTALAMNEVTEMDAVLDEEPMGKVVAFHY